MQEAQPAYAAAYANRKISIEKFNLHMRNIASAYARYYPRICGGFMEYILDPSPAYTRCPLKYMPLKNLFIEPIPYNIVRDGCIDEERVEE